MENCKLTGRVLSKEFFNFYESTEINFEKIFKVLTGDIPGCIFRNIISEDVREKISQNFWGHSCVKKREDGVPAYYLGTYHYRKKLQDYLSEAKSMEDHLQGLFFNTETIFDNFIQGLFLYLKKFGIELRLAEYFGEKASPFVMRSWSNSGNYSLSPHEDLSQCLSSCQAGFEIQSVAENEVVAVNICIENHDGGDLHYWNMQPDEETRKKLGLDQVGYPYPIDLLLDHEKIIVPINSGDVYCFSGKNIHAVDEIKEKNSRRSTISFLMGFKNSNTVVYWS